MSSISNYAKGSIYNADPNKGAPTGMESIQKMNPVILNSYFTDTNGATCSRALYCNVAGNVNMEWADGTTSILTLVAGTTYPFKVYRILTSGTTATGISWGY